MGRAQERAMLHSGAPDDVVADENLYAAWRYSTLSADEFAALKLQGLSVAATLAIFRDEWRANYAIEEGGLP